MKAYSTTLTQTASWRDYYWLTKPGIIYGNSLPAMATFLFASHGAGFSFLKFIAVVLGQSCIIAAGCIANNYQDRTIDAHMKRTRQRALVTGAIPAERALLLSVLFLVLGSTVLLIFVNILTLWVGLIGFVSYVFLYGATKRRGPYGTLVGSIAGATPPVAGYTAVTGRLDVTALILFLILVTWQMPHFYAIALRRKKDYAAAKVPVLAVRASARTTKLNIIFYVAAFALAASALTVFSHAGYIYLAVVLLLSGVWLYKGIRGFNASDDTVWAKNMFLFSLIVLLVLCAAIALSPWLA